MGRGLGAVGKSRRGGNAFWGEGVLPQCSQLLESIWAQFPGLPEMKHWCRKFPLVRYPAGPAQAEIGHYGHLPWCLG